jgi:hypothetical protein
MVRGCHARSFSYNDIFFQGTMLRRVLTTYLSMLSGNNLLLHQLLLAIKEAIVVQS